MPSVGAAKEIEYSVVGPGWTRVVAVLGIGFGSRTNRAFKHGGQHKQLKRESGGKCER